MVRDKRSRLRRRLIRPFGMGFFRRNGLSLVTFALFLIFLVGQTFTGMAEFNEERQGDEKPPVGLSEYLGEGHFLEAVTENWESEFLQMAMFVVFTVFLYQKGSPESKDPEKEEPEDREPDPNRPDAPGIVKRGGLALAFYKHSLTIVLLTLFALSFVGHAVFGVREYNDEREKRKLAPITASEYVRSSRFWFESFQNWQSEFLAVFTLAVSGIYLRQKGSPESKPVDAPHSETGRGT